MLKKFGHLSVTGLVVLALFYIGFVPAGLGFMGQPHRVPTLEELSRENPGTTAFREIRAQEARERRRHWSPRQTWVPLSRISPALINAVIAAEDSTFYSHRGVEWKLTARVFWESLRTGRKDRGASTITQQVARNLYLSPRKSYLRKMRELVVAQRMEQLLSKRRILEIYLNIAEWGEGVFGAEAAAQAYFGKSASALTWEEAVALTAVLPSPRRHRPTDNTRWVELRRNWVWSRLAQTGRYTAPPPSDPPTL